jgi:predicted transcriptional regulator
MEVVVIRMPPSLKQRLDAVTKAHESNRFPGKSPTGKTLNQQDHMRAAIAAYVASLEGVPPPKPPCQAKE